MAQTNVKLKLLINLRSSKVLFAEADKGFVDFLFSLLTLPIGTVTLLLKENEGMVGSLGSLYKSIESLDKSYVVADHSKNALLHPEGTLSSQANALPLLACKNVVYANASTVSKFLYKCSHRGFGSCNYVSEQSGIQCPSCGGNMNTQLTILDQSSKTMTATKSASGGGGGYVKGVVTYMVMDDLSVKPMSTISGITLLKTFNVRDLSSLEEKTVNIGMSECLKLLKASLSSKTVLTDVFLH